MLKKNQVAGPVFQRHYTFDISYLRAVTWQS